MALAKYKTPLLIGGFIAAFIIGLGVSQFISLRKAHGSFANYYAFRGCVQLINKTPTSGTCKTKSGKVIKIVQFHGRWYLDGDLPHCIGNFCF